MNLEDCEVELTFLKTHFGWRYIQNLSSVSGCSSGDVCLSAIRCGKKGKFLHETECDMINANSGTGTGVLSTLVRMHKYIYNFCVM